MPENYPIKTPAGFAPANAVGFANSDGEMVLVSGDNPMPVSNAGAPPPLPLEGTATQNEIVGPFAPLAGRAVNIQLDGTWQGNVQLLRSVDSGTTKLPVTLAGEPWAQFTSNANEPAWLESEGDVELYLDLTLTSGTLAYRVSQ